LPFKCNLQRYNVAADQFDLKEDGAVAGAAAAGAAAKAEATTKASLGGVRSRGVRAAAAAKGSKARAVGSKARGAVRGRGGALHVESS
jgi:hypothetical protein